MNREEMLVMQMDKIQTEPNTSGGGGDITDTQSQDFTNGVSFSTQEASGGNMSNQ